MSEMKRYVVAGNRPWSRVAFDQWVAPLPGEWHFTALPSELTRDYLGRLQPRYVFFLHWSSRVPSWTTRQYECVNFHMTDVPYGRGGTPLQNLIEGGHSSTVVSALRMTDALDAGPVYAKREMPLHGAAEEIYERAASLSALMIAEIIANEPQPVDQAGEVVEFRRRIPSDSELRSPQTLEQIYDAIRMVDAEGYPHAFIRLGDLKMEFRRAVRYAGRVKADVTITQEPKKEP